MESMAWRYQKKHYMCHTTAEIVGIVAANLFVMVVLTVDGVNEMGC